VLQMIQEHRGNMMLVVPTILHALVNHPDAESFDLASMRTTGFRCNDRVFDVALSELLAEGVYREERWSWGLEGGERAMQFYELEDETVWGATARMLVQLVELAIDGAP